MAGEHLTDQQVADAVRMLMRDQIDHEAVCTMARDRIVALSAQVTELQKLGPRAEAGPSEVMTCAKGHAPALYRLEDGCFACRLTAERDAARADWRKARTDLFLSRREAVEAQALVERLWKAQQWEDISSVPTGSLHPYDQREGHGQFVLYWNGFHVGVGYAQIDDDDPDGLHYLDETGDSIEPKPTKWARLPNPGNFIALTPTTALASHDARVKASGAAEWLRGYLQGLFNMQPEEYKGAALQPLKEELNRLEQLVESGDSLAAHDAEVRRKCKEEAEREIADQLAERFGWEQGSVETPLAQWIDDYISTARDAEVRKRVLLEAAVFVQSCSGRVATTEEVKLLVECAKQLRQMAEEAVNG